MVSEIGPDGKYHRLYVAIRNVAALSGVARPEHAAKAAVRQVMEDEVRDRFIGHALNKAEPGEKVTVTLGEHRDLTMQFSAATRINVGDKVTKRKVRF